ncbi:hypothetical protein DNH61_16310 [Paenibacillus sambharensis]|uniref:Tetrapyrrole methylase domain-containing protein n=1 Tax=Paenibacillus sambharensis TaxID=1803190 RepID=A0A2W1LIC3_9BACL|nr:SAM-dependent methyltransferase [Paenibacillus sambharensis]PZD94792.1 hypothetical protein DNH61_16310 [Paenibacillus sambharensis]
MLEVPHAYTNAEEQMEQLMREIAKTAESLDGSVEQQQGRAADAPKGRLIIMGSGIASAGFTLDTEMYLKAADYVFFVVTDAVTKIWIRERRPDAYDLSALYSDNKPRYSTYMQMTEAMLYYVRQGKTVAGIYYGHPGVFALSTHRAVAIARREGHQAVMKPGISALDCLCADLGVDPSYPGMQTMEATDMLLRGKAPDTTQHVVLWQAGLVGVTGFRRRGYLNKNFNVLVEFLQGVYGPDYEVTHYIAAHYPTLPPVVDQWRLSDLLMPDVQASIQGLSTFYIPPKDSTESHVEMAVRIGMAKPGSRPWTYPARKVIDLYGDREIQAIRELADYCIPADYQHPERTHAAEFMLELTRDLELQDLYECDPASALSNDRFPDLDAWERRLLMSRQPGNLNCAVKGSDTPRSPGEQLIIDMLAAPEFTAAYSLALKLAEAADDRQDFMHAWHKSRGYAATMNDVRAALPNVEATMLLPWTGAYYCPGNDLVLTVMSDSQDHTACAVYLNNTRIRRFSFANSTLIWNEDDGNPSHGALVFRMAEAAADHAARIIEGKIWRGDNPPVESNVIASEIILPEQQVTGEHEYVQSGLGQFAVQLYQEGQWSGFYQLYDGGSALYIGSEEISPVNRCADQISWQRAGGAFGSGCLRLFVDPLTGQPSISGYIWTEGAQKPAAANLRGRWVARPLDIWNGRYETAAGQEKGPDLIISAASGSEAGAVWLGETRLEEVTYRSGILKASVKGGVGLEAAFQLTEQEQRCFVGRLVQNGTAEGWSSTDAPSTPDAWCGNYGTVCRRKDGTFVPSTVTFTLVNNGDGLQVVLADGSNTRTITNVVFNSRFNGIAWNDSPAGTQWTDYSNAMIKFHADYDTGERMFGGMFWSEGEEPPVQANWRGQTSWALASISGETSADEFDSMQGQVWRRLALVSLSGGSQLPGSFWERWTAVRSTVDFCFKALREKPLSGVKG